MEPAINNRADNAAVELTTVIKKSAATKLASATKKCTLDKFYTVPEVAKRCLYEVGARYNWADWDLVIEPSAGNGSFLTQIPTARRIGIDILPEHKEIIEQDFLTYTPPETAVRILVVGNPPFGRVSSQAIKFFNHAAQWAEVIAFIIPRTFRRVSVQNKLDMRFHLVHDEEIATTPCAFTPPMMAKCCFQIWEKKENRRSSVDLPTTHADWEFLKLGPNDECGQPTPPINADFVIRAYGGKCGEIKTAGLPELRPKSWHWIKANIKTDELMRRFSTLDYSLSVNTARQNSIGRGELVQLYAKKYSREPALMQLYPAPP
jgi:predicted RNA methylase